MTPESPNEIHLTLIRSTDDPPSHDSAYQQELRGVEQSIHAQGLQVSSIVNLREQVGGGSTHLGEFFIQITPTLLTVVGGVVGAWLHARYGRKVRLKVGDIEAEARTIEEVERLLAHAQEIQQRNRSKLVSER